MNNSELLFKFGQDIMDKCVLEIQITVQITVQIWCNFCGTQYVYEVLPNFIINNHLKNSELLYKSGQDFMDKCFLEIKDW